MSYQVLARKYRPSNFTEVAGQEHVLKALTNALESERLHHAYLFTGTRGVGKTSIARILARCLNCEKGVTAVPCGECSSCLEISEGRSVDLIEVDAASRTKVEDTRELLDNVQYLPTHSRFKIYLIDEVHMLSNHSFNALLKTLEEPPEHVKFLLATTDPKKLPVTVLSRCLQFNLKNLTPEGIVDCLKDILATEAVAFEEKALWLLGRAADGSMRDALSLTDQAISFSSDNLSEEAVKSMLGSMDQNEVFELLYALVKSDGAALLDKVAALSQFAPDYEALLASLLSILHRIAVVQLVPGALDNTQGDQEAVEKLAGSMSKEDVQLYYQIGVLGQKDLPYAPDPRSGFEMILLRMLAFEPIVPGADVSHLDENEKSGKKNTHKTEAEVTDSHPSHSEVSNLSERTINSAGSSDTSSDTSSAGAQAALKAIQASVAPKPPSVPEVGPDINETPEVHSGHSESPHQQAETTAETTYVPLDVNWSELADEIALDGIARTLAINCFLENFESSEWVMVMSKDYESLWNEQQELRIANAISKHLGQKIIVRIKVGTPGGETPAERIQREEKERQLKAEADIKDDANVRTLVDQFDGRVNEKSIRPVRSPASSKGG